MVGDLARGRHREHRKMKADVGKRMKIDSLWYRAKVARCSGQAAFFEKRYLRGPGSPAHVPGALWRSAVSVFLKIEGIVNVVYPADIHSALRYEAVMDRSGLSELMGRGGRVVVTDVGGSMNFALLFLAYFRESVERYNLVVYDPAEAALAREQVRLCGVDAYVRVHSGDANGFSSLVGGPSDAIFMVDVLEHVEDDAGAVLEARRNLKPGGLLFVSVPTPWYPVYFGRKFHELVGHLRDGYTAGDLSLLMDGFSQRSLKAYVNAWAGRIIGSHYRLIPDHAGLLAWLTFITLPWLRPLVAALDAIPSIGGYASLAAVYAKKGD
jgi:SAM-dependent methyltransferase